MFASVVTWRVLRPHTHTHQGTRLFIRRNYTGAIEGENVVQRWVVSLNLALNQPDITEGDIANTDIRPHKKKLVIVPARA
jgi:hypothetical protein